GLVNVVNLKAGGLGWLGPEQLAWLRDDLRGRAASTPIVVFAHIPLWSVYPEWGWGTDDSAEVMALLRRFGSVTVLNGHIHQTLQKVKGHVTFHTAMSTAFPQPAPGTAPSPGPLTVEPGRLRSLLGITSVTFRQGQEALGVVDTPLAVAGATAMMAPRATEPRAAMPVQPGTVRIDNFQFSPETIRIPAGKSVTWVNADDVPHRIASADGGFAPSPPLDTDQRFTLGFARPGRFRYFCALHPRMTGTVVVE
ncbi:MAG TPA: cupredoxin domain-containing protein, partial [Gemmatimonadales bacterium]|nr:cupredoxin domain-containing protein [Gemmatimonadales bacterium]